jgi:tRNA pseudouridine38-40 synthase
MVRILSGTLLEVGLRERSAESVLKALEERNRQLAGKTLSSVGLFLVKVEY